MLSWGGHAGEAACGADFGGLEALFDGRELGFEPAIIMSVFDGLLCNWRERERRKIRKGDAR